jgi:prepilin-type N-terminal cleavage/methylation domain-containing protein
MKTQMQRGFTLIELLVVITIIAILASLAVPTFGRIQERGNITKGISNARQIITALRIYAADHGGNYPDVALDDEEEAGNDANTVFRTLFTEQILDAETIFGCPVSSLGNPDGDIGSAPNYENALQTKENHWMMTGGASDSASGSLPLVYENAVSADWNPTWNAKAAGTTAEGRAWSGGKIIMGQNDSSVALQQLEDKNGTATPLKSPNGGQNLFQRFDESGFTVLNATGGK